MHRIAVAVVALGLAVPALAQEMSAAATVGGTVITQATLEKHVKSKLIEIDNERYEALKEGLDELVGEELFNQEAKARKITPAQLEETEITAKVAKQHVRIYEVPITYSGRDYSEGKKIGMKDAFIAVWAIVRWGLFA